MKKLALILAVSMFFGLAQASFAQPNDQKPGKGPFFSEQFPGKGKRFEGGERNGPPGLMKKLNLTEEQARKAKEMREQSRSQIKPVIDQIRAERQKLMELRQQNATQEQLTAQKEKMKSLVEQAKSIHKQNLGSFESILNADQKVQFEAMKKQRMEHFKGKRGHGDFKNFGERKNFMEKQ